MTRKSAATPQPAAEPDDLRQAALARRAARQGQRTGVAADPATIAAAPASAGPDLAGPGALQETTVPVAGMTCRACEVRIQRHVGRLPGVERVTASAVHGRVVVESTGPVNAASIEKAINDAGYEIGRTPWVETNPRVWMTAAAGALIVAVVAVLIRVTGLADVASGAGDLASGGLLVALLLGLTAGVSTCMALVGGLLLALTAAFEARRAADGDTTSGLATRLRPALVFMGGRIVGYGILGAALGALGASVAMPPMLTAVLMVAVGVLMSLLGARLTGLSPRLATWSPTLPMGLGRRLGLETGSTAAYSDVRAAGLGAASFFLPCGFTQAVQVYALSTGNPLTAGAIMAVFAIGTAPGLLALAGLPLVIPTAFRPTLLRLVGVVVIVFALVNVSAGLRLAGVSVPGVGASQPVAAADQSGSGVTAGGAQTLVTYQDVDGYSPGNVAIAAGIPTHWTIESKSVQTCAAFLVVPGLDIQVRLHKGTNTIELPAMPAGTLAYSCSMGMYGGQITIQDRPTGLTGGPGFIR